MNDELEFLKPFNIEEKREEIIQKFRQKSGKLDYIPLIGDDYMTLIDIFLFELSKFSELINHRISQNYINYSRGAYLDELVALIGLKRYESINPVATVEIKTNDRVYLSKGTILKNEQNQRAVLLYDVSVNGVATFDVELKDYEEGQDYSTVVLEKENIYIDSLKILNPYNTKKRVESDEELKRRFILALHRFSTAGSVESYTYHCLSVASIKKVNVYQKSAGIVKIVYQGLLDRELQELKLLETLEDRRPLTDKIEFKEVEKVNIDINLQISLKNNTFYNDYAQAIKQNIKKFFNSLDIGENIHSSKIIDIAYNNNEDIKSIELLQELPNINQDSIYSLNNINVSLKNA